MVKLVDVSMNNGYYDTAAYIIDTYLVGKSLEDKDYNKIDQYSVKLTNFYNTSEAVDKIFQISEEQSTVENLDNQEMKKQLNELLGREDMDQAYIYYCLGLIEEDKSNARKYMQQCYNLDQECVDVRARLCVLNRRLGDMDQAKRYGKEALNKDKKDIEALRALSTVALAEGNLEKGLRYAEEAYKLNPEGAYIRDTYLVALAAAGRNEDAMAVKEEMIGAGQTLDEDTERLLNNELTLQEYYIGE
jgi:tetratricopeptide (TPR) repeat protein